MGIIGHKERALIRRGLYVENALKRRDTLNELASTRRQMDNQLSIGFQDFRSLDDVKSKILCEKSKKDTKKSKFWCGVYKYCSLLTDDKTKQKVYNNIEIIYEKLKPANVDNRTLMYKIGIEILKHTDPKVVFEMLADWLTNPVEINNDGVEIKLSREEFIKKLNTFTKVSSELTEKEAIEDFLKKVRAIEYSLYEKSFVSQNFSKNSGWIELSHGLGDQKFVDIISLIVDNIEDYKLKQNGELTNVIYRNNGLYTIKNITEKMLLTIKNMDPNEFKNKGDLKVEQDLYVGDEVLIPAESLVEVKKIYYAKDSYFSEFFAIYKNIPNKNDINSKVYKTIILGLYRNLNKTLEGDNILKEIGDGISAMFFDEEILVLTKDIELYWSTTGARDCNKEPRLTIRYRVKNPDAVFYKYNKNTHSNILEVLPKTPFKIPFKKEICN